MPASDGSYPEVKKNWKATCRVLLGEEVGELDDFSEWLYDYNGPRRIEKSEKSGKPVLSYDGRYSSGAKWISLDEVDFSAPAPALSINQVKDIDSIVQGISELAIYTGNMCLGNSAHVEDSATVMDSHYIFHSESVWDSKYVAYTTHAIGECVFGGKCVSSNFLIRCNTIHSERCFEASKCDLCSGLYYAHGLSSCHDCMFSFNLRSKRNRIGNLELPKDKYAALKQKLVAEMHENLKKDKWLPHHLDLFKSCKPDYSALRVVYSKMPLQPPKKTDTAAIEEAFSQTTKLVFGIPYKGIDKYAPWLKRNTRRFEDGKSCASGKPLLVPEYADFTLFPRDRLLGFEEAEFIGERLAISEAEAESLTLAGAGSILSKVGYFSPDWKSGNNFNNIGCPIEFNCTDCYRSIINLFSKRCAFGWWPRESEYLFGHNRTRHSAFCINCFDSEKIQRCFEVSEARDCTGCYYCHNVENVHDSMFCFNTKNKKYAVGNVEVGREKYSEVKALVLAQLNAELSKTNSIALSIFNLPDYIRKKGE